MSSTGRSTGQVIVFFVLACALSWLDWGLVIASANGWVGFKFPLNPWGSFGPAIAAVAMSVAAAGRGGLRELFAPLLRWRFGATMWLVVLLGPVVLVALSVAIYALTGGQVLPVGDLDVATLAIYAVVLLFVGGPLGEEIGWRGYALPGLLARTSPLAASLIVAAMWAVWHLPLFWMPGAAQEGSSIVMFVAIVSAFSILTTWVYLATGNSLLAAVFFHHSINLSTYFLPTVFPALDSAPRYSPIFLGVTSIAALAAVVALARSRPSTTVSETVPTTVSETVPGT